MDEFGSESIRHVPHPPLHSSSFVLPPSALSAFLRPRRRPGGAARPGPAAARLADAGRPWRAEMERARQGLLVRLPRDEFEKLVGRAARAEAARKNPPRLVAAFYQAHLAEGGLAGYFKWKVIHTAAGPGLLPLTPLNLALRQPRLAPLNPEPGQPPGGPDAYVGDFDGHDPSLLIESPGEYEASDDWSARAEPGPKGLQFDLHFPACPAAVLELDLPPDMAPVLDGGVLGPDDADAPNLRKWTIPCGGRSQVALLIRQADQAPVLRASLETTQTLSPEGLDATYAFSVQSLHRGVRKLTFECDPALRPYDVDAPGLDRWDVAPPGAEGRRRPADRPSVGAAGRGDRPHPLRRAARRPRARLKPRRVGQPRRPPAPVRQRRRDAGAAGPSRPAPGGRGVRGVPPPGGGDGEGRGRPDPVPAADLPGRRPGGAGRPPARDAAPPRRRVPRPSAGLVARRSFGA